MRYKISALNVEIYTASSGPPQNWQNGKMSWSLRGNLGVCLTAVV